jgi:hypothetical protein
MGVLVKNSRRIYEIDNVGLGREIFKLLFYALAFVLKYIDPLII